MTSDLRGLEAERGGADVSPVALHQMEAAFLRQPQVPSGGQVAQAEGLAPAGVAPAPPVKKQGNQQHNNHNVMWL